MRPPSFSPAQRLRALLFLRKTFGESCEVNFDFLDLVSFDPEELGAAKFAAVVTGAFIANKGFVAFFEELLDLKRADVLAVRPAPLEIRSLIDVIIERAGESEVVTQ